MCVMFRDLEDINGSIVGCSASCHCSQMYDLNSRRVDWWKFFLCNAKSIYKYAHNCVLHLADLILLNRQ
jgi:hypothetical protein